MFRRIERSDKEWIDNFITEHWGGNFIIVHGCKYIPCCLDGFIACDGSERVGLITYQIQNNSCEIISLNSVIPNRGIGKGLMKLVEAEALNNHCKSIWLVTTNDNLCAIEFYKKLGYDLIRTHYNAVEKSRELKPNIPLIALNGIQIMDELEFAKVL